MLIRPQSIAEVKNPIGLARIILDESTKPLSLARVPPNLLVGLGATDYAYDKGIPVLPNEYLVSNGSRDRWQRWKQDLLAADERELHDAEASRPRYEDHDAIDQGSVPRAAFSPPTSPTPAGGTKLGLSNIPTPVRPLMASTADLPSSYFDLHKGYGGHSPGSDSASLGPSRTSSSSALRHRGYNNDKDVAMDDNIQWTAKRPRIDGSLDNSVPPLRTIEVLSARTHNAAENPYEKSEDCITDTVGAIAVDCFGNIAAGSSSGGIGMKHKGRTGPAALVGIGTAVVPIDPRDRDRTCVATVTSGTGEHMATTMAAATCADRIYSGVRKLPGGVLEKCTEDEAMKNMIKEEFMNHPGVTNSHCAGAIGVMAVKKTRDGIFLYFGHNTDSFALASMHSEERKPVCTMSRNTGNAAIAQGGRAAKYRR